MAASALIVLLGSLLVGALLIWKGLALFRPSFLSAVIAEARLSQTHLDVLLPEARLYSIWLRRLREYSFLEDESRPLFLNFNPVLKDKTSGLPVPLSRAVSGVTIRNTETYRVKQFTFFAHPGSYELDFGPTPTFMDAASLASVIQGKEMVSPEGVSVQIREASPFIKGFLSVVLLALGTLLIVGGGIWAVKAGG